MTFVPQRYVISNITNSDPAVVITSTNNTLTTGQIVRIHVPRNYAMYELNQLALQITVLTANTFSLQYSQVPNYVNVNSTNYNAFTVPANPQFTAEVLSIGSGTTPIFSPFWAQQNNLAITTINDATTNINTVEIPF